ncbi:MAG: hypothetical protein WBM50_05685, partial [Acidimicrobiales bacterium]
MTRRSRRTGRTRTTNLHSSAERVATRGSLLAALVLSLGMLGPGSPPSGATAAAAESSIVATAAARAPGSTGSRPAA